MLVEQFENMMLDMEPSGFAASSTLLTDQNAWTKLQQFSSATSTLLSAGTLWDTGLSSALLGVNASGQVVSTSTIGANLLTGTLGVANGGTGATSLSGLLQGNGTGAITGISGTAGQFSYYNGTNTLLATSSLFLASSGNLGIGTASPGQPLTFPGTASVGTLVTSGTNSFVTGVGGLNEGNVILGDPSYGSRADTSILFWTAAGAARLAVNNSDRFNFDDYGNTTGTGAYISGAVGGTDYFSGNVGINNSSPSYALDVGGFVNVNATTGGYKQGGNTILSASSTVRSIAAGIGAGANLNASSSLDTALGYYALNTATSSWLDTAIGAYALANDSGGGTNGLLHSNVAVGDSALQSNTYGFYNNALGSNALLANTIGDYNAVIGTNALETATSATADTVVGYQAGEQISGATGAVVGDNSIFGFSCGFGMTTGGENTIFGACPDAAS